MEQLLLDRRLQTMVEEYVPSGDTLYQLVDLFSLFSDYTRLRIISALSITEMCVNDISKLLNINQTTVSHQLKLLKTSGAVKSLRQGKVIFYSIRNEMLSDILLKGVEFLGY
ncbi:MAG: helix-turn-helix transcriptional regulator [Clostridia bacterium]|nr:helix-turn-helix transcriptional regulator [Clostridia bacterium]MBQ9514310.1 helix-turn-helix transcriptional regulator [Clostridia bacterium]